MNRENLQYHALNIIAVFLFSYITAVTVNQFVSYGLTSGASDIGKPGSGHTRGYRALRNPSSFDYYTPILESGFFMVGDAVNIGEEGYVAAAESSDLELIGTITGPGSVARAVIQERSEKSPGIYKLWTDVYGYRLVRIKKTKVHLKSSERVIILDMYDKSKSVSTRKPEPGVSEPPASASKREPDTAAKTVSSAELKNYEGFTVTNLPESNPLYQKGLRKGDIIKAINDTPIKNTNDYIRKASSVVNEESIILTVERNGSLMKINISGAGQQ